MIGIIVAQFSTSYVNRFARSPALMKLLAQPLIIKQRVHFLCLFRPVPMLLVGPNGLWLPIPVSAAEKYL